VSAGRLRTVLTAQRLDESGDDGAGNPQTNWVDALSGIPAELKPVRSKEMSGTQGVRAETQFIVRVRWHPDLENLTTKDRFLHSGNDKKLLIQGVPINPDQRRRYLEISVKQSD